MAAARILQTGVEKIAAVRIIQTGGKKMTAARRLQPGGEKMATKSRLQMKHSKWPLIGDNRVEERRWPQPNGKEMASAVRLRPGGEKMASAETEVIGFSLSSLTNSRGMYIHSEINRRVIKFSTAHYINIFRASVAVVMVNTAPKLL